MIIMGEVNLPYDAQWAKYWQVIYLVQLRACCRNGGVFKCKEYAAMEFGNSEERSTEFQEITCEPFLHGTLLHLSSNTKNYTP